MIASLPQELVDVIINLVSLDDRPTLMSCALISRAFRSWSQRRLFDRISLSNSASTTCLLFALAASPHLGQQTRKLELLPHSRRCHEQNAADHPPFGAARGWADTDLHLPHILLHLPALEHIRISGLSFTACSPLWAHTASLSHVRSVRLDGHYRIKSHSTLARFLCELPALDELYLGDGEICTWGKQWRNSPAPPLLRLGRLELDGCYSTSTQLGDMLPLYIGAVQKLTVALSTYADAVMLSDIVPSLGPGLESLCVHATRQIWPTLSNFG
jgi:hypothetical protein